MAVTPQTPKSHHNRGVCHSHDLKLGINSFSQFLTVGIFHIFFHWQNKHLLFNFKYHKTNYIFILGLKPGVNVLGRGDCKTRRDSFTFWNLVRPIFEILQYMFRRCHRSSTAATPVKYKCDSRNLTDTFARSKIVLVEELANGTLVTPNPELCIMRSYMVSFRIYQTYYPSYFTNFTQCIDWVISHIC